jgi:hypothetical protein
MKPADCQLEFGNGELGKVLINFVVIESQLGFDFGGTQMVVDGNVAEGVDGKGIWGMFG